MTRNWHRTPAARHRSATADANFRGEVGIEKMALDHPSRMEDQWLSFALRQAARSAPHPAPDTLAGGGASTGYRLSLLFLESLPLFQAQDRSFDVRLGVTLYDEAAGCFFGPTAHSAAVQYDLRRSKG